MDTQMVFKRYEIKYLLNRKQREKVMTAMSAHMEPDRYGRSTIRNLYYDTDTYRLARRSLEKPVYKEKLRVRSYAPAGPGDSVYVELKKKYEDVVYKRRIQMTEEQAASCLTGRRSLPGNGQITEEIRYFLQFYETLAPRAFLSYEREAYYARESDSFRVTFDENILWRDTDLSLGCGVYGTGILPPGYALMEIKTPGSIPLWMVRVLSEEGIRKASFSKYGRAYQDMWNSWQQEGKTAAGF